MKNAGIRRAFLLIILIFLLGSTRGYADQAIMDQVSFEVKFFLSPDKVLAENHLLTEAAADRFSLGQ